MSIRLKIIGTLAIMGLVILCILGTIILIISSRVRAHSGAMLATVNEDLKTIAETQIEALAEEVSNSLITFEMEIDKNMLNAAKLLREADYLTGGRLTMDDLERLRKETGMSDLYIGDVNGVFTLTTETKAMGRSLFDINPSYRQLITGESASMPSIMRLRSTQEIFKFTAIPRLGGRGVLESSLVAQDINDYLKRHITKETGIQSMNLFDQDSLTLINLLAPGHRDIYSLGSKAADSPEIAALFKDPSQIKLLVDDKEARIFYPVTNGTIRYVLFLAVDMTPYFAVAHHIEGPLKNLAGEMSRLNALAFGAVLFSLTLCTTIVGIIITRLLKPLDFFITTLESFAQGDFMIPIPEAFLKRKDEAGYIAHAFSDTIEQLSGMIIMVKNHMSELQHTGESLEMSVVSNQQQSAIINRHILMVTAKADQQTESVDKVSISMSGITTNISSLDDSIVGQNTIIAQSNEDIKGLLQSITDEQTIIGHLTSQMARLVDTTEEGKQKQTLLDEQVKHIFGLSETLNNTNRMISNIAAQTNLLAMNAAIEAAHAGVAGQGFAVVADEIRKLAEDTTSHSKAVGTQIKEIQGGIELVVNASGVTRKSVDTMIQYIGEVSNFINDATASINNQNERSESIRSQLHVILELSNQVETNASNMRDESKTVLSEIDQVKGLSLDVRDWVHQVSSSTAAISAVSETAITLTHETQKKMTDISEHLDAFKVSG
jgi:methyl-accepting chemotaxis protein